MLRQVKKTIFTDSASNLRKEAASRPADQNRMAVRFIDVVFFLLALATMVVVTYLYVSNERIIYWSDYSGYQDITHNMVVAYRTSFSELIRAIIISMGAEYNALFSIPLLPFILIFGESRLAFELSLALVYLFPLALVLGSIAVRLIRAPARPVFWSTVALALLTPTFWIPTLRGYADASSALLIALAVRIYVQDTKLKYWWQLLLIGFLLAAAMLLRRHFVYGVTGFFASIGLQHLIVCTLEARHHRRQALRQFIVGSLRIALTASMTGITLLIFGRAFLHRLLTNNYDSLRGSYISPLLSVLQSYINVYSWPIVVCVVVGMIVSIRQRIVERNIALFIIIFAAVSVVQWLTFVLQIAVHYTHHFTPFVVIGLAVCMWTARSYLSKSTSFVAAGFATAYVVVNMVAGMTFTEITNNAFVRSLFAEKEAPLTRPDYDQVVQLIHYLRDVAPNGEPIFVVGSSDIINRGLVRNAERALYGWNNATLNILQVPQIDSRDFLPVDMVLQSQYVVIAEPFQQHLGQAKQRVVKSVFDMFANQDEISRDFTRIPANITLANNTSLSVYKRTRPTPLPTAIRILSFTQRLIPERPGRQPDWVTLSQQHPPSVNIEQDATFEITTPVNHFMPGEASTFLYYDVQPSRGVLSGTITFTDQRCSGIVLNVAQARPDGQVTDVANVVKHPKDTTFSIPFSKQDGNYLLLTFSNSVQSPRNTDCSTTIRHLQVKAE